MAARAVIIGGGHNGLVCAFYLARAGMAVTVCERRQIVGGAAVTEEFHPGFRNSVASYTVSLLDAGVIADMALHEQGLRILDRPLANFLPTDDGRYLKLGDLARSQSEVAKFSARDAEALPRYYDRIARAAGLLRDLARRTPPNQPDGAAGLARALGQGHALRRLPAETQRDVLALFTRSAREVLDDWFESDPIKAVLGFDSIVGHYASPETPGTAYVLLHHAFGGVNGRPGSWGHAVGGMGAITQAMAAACRAAGAEILLGAPVERVLTENGRAAGVRLASGRELPADIVAANVHPRLLFERLIDPAALRPEFRQRIAQYRSGSGTFRMNVALSELPDFSALPGTAPAEHHRSGIVIGPSLAYMDRAYHDARAQGWSRAPIIEMLIPSTLDDTLAPAGRHVASLFCQHVQPALAGGWAGARDTVAELMIDTITQYSPNFRRSVLGRVAFSPEDLEQTFGLVGGDIFHGRMSLDQLWVARPLLGHASYRAPVRGLYLCGSGTHPGGGVSGLPGRNAAREVLRDRRWRLFRSGPA